MTDWVHISGTAPAYLALPPAGKGPAVVVLHAWWGLNDDIKLICDRLAGEGFVVAAPDMFGGAVASKIEEAEQLIKNYDDKAVLTSVVGTVEYLKKHPAVNGIGMGAVGFSFGAAWALLLSTIAPDQVDAVVTFYGTYEADFSKARAAYQGHYVVSDPWEPQEGVGSLENAIRAAGHPVEFFTYEDASHWFMEESRPQYKPAAAGEAWERMLAFLRAHLYREPE